VLAVGRGGRRDELRHHMTNTLDEATRGKGLVSAFQRVVSLPSETTIGYEALARWPTLNNAAPTEIFAHAEKTNKLNRLDRACIKSAVRGALQGDSTPGMLLLVNCEPATRYINPSDCPDLLRAANSFRLTFEFTERGLLAHPRALLRKVAALRELGFAIALDDIGPHPETLALLDIVAPDILKLDMQLVQHQPDRLQARTVAAVIAHQERTGAIICAEGIETDEHLEQAMAYGATLGQGYRFGVPGDLSSGSTPSSWPARIKAHATADTSIFDPTSAGLTTRRLRKQALLELSDHIERLALTAECPPIVLATVQTAESFTGAMRKKYSTIAKRCPLVAVFGENIPPDLEPGVRGVHLDPDDPLSREWTILVLGPETAAGLVAHEMRCPASATGQDKEARFDTVITFDRERVTAAARSLLDRLS
jgi:EAL domain-containing protein (putative c-di-GMP-specific phosphodiesterase class I)